jgi:hypothetical protein
MLFIKDFRFEESGYPGFKQAIVELNPPPGG